MLRVDQLIAYTRAFHAQVIRNAKQVNIRVLKISGDPKDPEFRKVELVARGLTIPRYVTLLFWGPYSPQARVWASCTCPYFKYTAEVALERQGSSDIIYSNGALPEERNPRNIPIICKHVMSALYWETFKLKPKNIIKK